MWTMIWLGDATHPPEICESYNGVQYNVYSSRQTAERDLRQDVAANMYPGNYAVVPIPTYGVAREDLADPEYHKPSYMDNPALTEAQIEAYWAILDAQDAGA